MGANRVKLPIPDLSVSDEMAEFDLWVTASLGEIRDTEKFQNILTKSCAVMDLLDEATGGFKDVAACQPEAIGKAVIEHITTLNRQEASEVLEDLGALLYLVTGKSDNNGKCQFPLHLRDVLRVNKLPRGAGRGFTQVDVPRVLKLDKYMAWVADLHQHPVEQSRMLQMFLDFILTGPHSSEQVWAIGYSYHRLKEVGKHLGLLSPLVVFQIRGSVSATGGHDPERKLRDEMAIWGLEPDIDFNLSDVGVPELVGEQSQKSAAKTRKFDFALPYKTPGWSPRLLVQCQFYAGDSGSVSHKNVDQTPTGRSASVTRFKQVGFAAPRFIEYVDGAGYFASLNGDLRHLLELSDTQGFTQIRSAPIRFRRELQDIGFLVPLEIEQALLRTSFELDSAVQLIMSDGYTRSEVDRLHHHFVGVLDAERRAVARRYLLLDLCAVYGRQLRNEGLAGSFLCPGYGPFWGLKLDELSEVALQEAPILLEDWKQPSHFLEDVRWLCERGVAGLA